MTNGATVTLDKLIQWQDNARVVIELSSGYKCYIPSNEDKVFSTLLALQISQAKASIHCYDSEENIGGYQAHRLHRIIMVK